MTTIAPAVLPSAPAKVLFQGFVPLDKIDVVSNIRKTFNEAALAELAASVKERGVDQPILLRPAEASGRYVLVDGERRFRAAKTGALKEIPAIVKELTAEGALLAQAISFLQRDDLGPIEEARGFELLTRGGKSGPAKYTVDEIAARLGKSVSRVYRALALLELPKDALAAIEGGKLTPAHGHQILRVPPFKRQDLTDDVLGRGFVMTASELRVHVEAQLGSDLTAARFPKDREYAGMSACTTCPSNSGNHGTLFDGAQKGTCLNGQCFASKTKQFKADFLDKVRVAHLDAKFVEYSKGYVYAGNNRPGGYIVKELLNAKKAPRGDFGLVISSRFEVWVATLDKKAQLQEEAASASVAEDPQAAFAARAVRSAIYAAAAAAAKRLKVERADWIKLAKKACDDLPNELWAAVLGVDPDAGDDGDFEKAPEALLRAIVLLNQRLPYSPDDAAFKKLGVDVAAVKKAATARAATDFIEVQASKGMEWPKNLAAIDKALKAALFAVSGADKRWEKARREGLSDERLREQIKSEWGEAMGSSSAGVEFACKRADFQFWAGTSSWSKGPPTLKGIATVNRARIVLQIPFAK